MTVMPKNTRTGDQVTGRIAESAIQSGISGNERNTSMTRCARPSIQPP